MSKIKMSNKNNLGTPGKPLSKEVFKALIEEAENGTFRSIEESRKSFQAWRKEKFQS